MKYFYSPLIAVLLFSITASAQSNYKPGYYITLKGDTTRGYIEQHAWDQNPKTVTFKPGLDKTESKKLGLSDIKQFSIDSSVTYIKSICRVSLGTTSENHLYAKDTTTKLDTVFLEVMQEGINISLYQYSDFDKTRYYYSENNATPQELIFRLYLNTRFPSTRTPRTTTENIFIQQFSTLALKYNVFDDRLQKILDNAEYKESDLLKISSAINSVSIPAPVKKKKNYVQLILAVIVMGFITYAVYNHASTF